MSTYVWTKMLLLGIILFLGAISILLYLFLFRFDPLEGTSSPFPIPNLDTETLRQLEKQPSS